jgi:hypothetical protein
MENLNLCDTLFLEINSGEQKKELLEANREYENFSQNYVYCSTYVVYVRISSRNSVVCILFVSFFNNSLAAERSST